MLQLFLENRASIQKLIVVALFLVAMWRGSSPERASSSVLLGMVIVQLVARNIAGLGHSYLALDPVSFLVDSLGLALFVAIALKANRFYPLILAAAQLVAFMAHPVRMLVEPVSSLAYYLLVAMPFWFQIVVLALGIGRHIRRESSLGNYRDWRGVPVMRRTASLS